MDLSGAVLATSRGFFHSEGVWLGSQCSWLMLMLPVPCPAGLLLKPSSGLKSPLLSCTPAG